jgi:uncharacterized protein (TIGR02145 family)
MLKMPLAVVLTAAAVGLVGCFWDAGWDDGEDLIPGGGDGLIPGGGGNVIHGTFTYDGQTYKTIKIGSGKTWMAENLNVETDSSRCYNDSDSYCDKYGRLYRWNAAKSACELLGGNWHLPSRAEWGELTIAAGGTGTYGNGGTAGTKLKSKTGWYGRGNGTDVYGFSALPGGGHDGSHFTHAEHSGFWWVATEHSSSTAFDRDMDHNTANVDEYGSPKYSYFSVRCVSN